MKTLTLNSFILDVGSETKTVNTCDVLLQVLESKGRNGLSLKEMRERLPIMGKIEKALADNEPTVDLEDAEIKILNELTESMQWNIVSKDIVALGDDLKALCG